MSRAGTHAMAALAAGADGDPSAPLLAVRKLTISRDVQPPLLHVPHLEVAAGEVVGLIGRSGCGKTTLLTCLSGDLPLTSGTFSLGGREEGRGVRSTFVSRTLQGAPLLHWTTVQGNLRLAARIRRVPQPDYRATLAAFAAEELADRFPTTLSGGERCRASLSQALLGDPRLLLLDEPFNGLDSAVKQFVAGNLLRVARERGAGVLLVTHDLRDALEFSDRIVVLGGKGPATVVAEMSAKAAGALSTVREHLGVQP